MVDTTNVQTDYLGQKGLYNIGATTKDNLDAETIKVLEESDRHSFLEDGTLVFTDQDGTTQVVPQSGSEKNINVSGLDASAVAELADLKFLAQNTGVSTSKMNAVYEKLGINGSTYNGSDISNTSVIADDILRAFGYKPGEQNDFYGANQAQDIGAQILQDRWADAPTDEELEAAGIDSSTVIVTNSNAANAAYLAEEMAKRNISADQTNARISGANRLKVNESNQIVQEAISKSPNAYWDDKISKAGSFGAATLDMLEWDLIKKKKEETTPGGSGNNATGGSGNNATGIVTGGTATDSGTGGITKGFTQDPNTLGIPDSAVLPTFAGGVSQVSPGASGTYTVPAQTFESNIKNQVEDFKDRATQQNFTTPQTITEKQAAGQDVSSYTMTQKLYRNPQTGDQQYFSFQGGQPLTPIPMGYYEVNQQTGSMGTGVFNPITAGGNTFTGANTGGVIQGYSGEEGSVVTPNPNPINPNQIYGDVSFTDPVTGQVITQTPEEYFQSLANKQAQATFNPATSVAMPGISTMAELGYEYNTDGTVKLDPATGQPVTRELMPGTVLESTAGQAQALAPVIGKRQATDASGNLMFDTAGQPIMVGADPAQVGQVVQAKGPGTPAKYDEAGNLLSAAVNIPGAAQVGLTTAAPGIATQLEGGTTTNYQGMADAVAGANWDVNTGTFNMNGQTFTPDQFVAANNLNIGDYLTTTGGLQAVQLSDPTQTITGQTDYTSSISDLTAKTGSSQTVADVAGEAGLPTRTLQTGPNGELITGTGVDQTQVGQAFGTGEVAAASVQDELAGLMAQFEGGDTPAWAAGSMRKASQMLAARGLGASSMAGQAVIQAAMEAALPIAQIDAGNKQQMALFKAEQRAKFLDQEFDQTFQAKVMNAAKVSEIANMNFSAEQQIALENSRAANTMDLQNLSNKQALVLAEASALSGLDLSSLGNLQQAQVQNAQNFLQIDMANLSNSQSTALFKAQQVSNAMLSDVAQANASAQFNATSANQTNQFFSNLAAQVSQFNAAQQNAINQFNSEEANAVLEFNSALQNQREMFNAQNYLAVAQANAQWRQNINTSNTEAQNVASLTYAKEVNGLTQKAIDDYWQKERDIMSYAFAQSEGAADRALKILLGEQSLTSIREQLEFKEEENKAEFWSDLLFGDQGFSDVFKMKKEEKEEGET